MNNLQKQIDIASEDLRKLRNSNPYLFAEYGRMMQCHLEYKEAKKRYKKAKKIWKNLL